MQSTRENAIFQGLFPRSLSGKRVDRARVYTRHDYELSGRLLSCDSTFMNEWPRVFSKKGPD